jgi:hypothetical protein
MRIELPAEIHCYVDALTAAFPEIESIWLIGSRANCSEHEGSDWDLLAFGDESTLKSLQARPDLSNPSVDLLVIRNENQFQTPWPDPNSPGTYKHGDLLSWEFHLPETGVGTYRASKWSGRDYENSETRGPRTVRTIRIWKKPVT